jgi:hypothetical protein
MEYPLSGIAWRKSTYSGTSGNNCVEVGQSWRKSTYVDTSGGNCAEVAHAWRESAYINTGGGSCAEVGQAAVVVVRDTTDREGRALMFPATAWRALLTQIGG